MITADKPSDGFSGKTPGLVSATHYANEFVISSPSDYSRGLLTLTIKRTDSELRSASTQASDQLRQASRDIKIDRLNIQRAQSAVVVTDDQGTEYAIVSDDNYNFLDPYWQAQFEAPMSSWTPAGYIYAGGSIAAKKVAVGGKLGVVKDPFAKKGAPKFLGATLPLDGYGITGLSVSEDGKVIIGQLKGGYGIIHQFIQQPSKNAAWNVKTLLDAANNMDDNKRMSDHLVVAGSEIPLVGSWTVGTYFDPPEPANAPVGRMGDILEVDAKRIAAWQLVVEEQVRASSAAEALAKGYDPATTLDKLTPAQLDEVNARAAKLKDFGFIPGEKANFVPNLSGLTAAADIKAANEAAKFHLLTRGAASATNDEVISTATLGAATPVAAHFYDSGVLYFAPNLTQADEDALRAGNRVDSKTAQIRITYKDDVTGDHTVTINLQTDDYTKAANTVFFGDRPLDNPGYSAFTLSTTVGAGIADTSALHVLDTYRVEQRLKYLGYSAFKKDASNVVKEFTVDGRWSAVDGLEETALRGFYGATTG